MDSQYGPKPNDQNAVVWFCSSLCSVQQHGPPTSHDSPLNNSIKTRMVSRSRLAVGIMRIEVCGDRVIHVIASPTSEIPTPMVPVVIQPCKAQNIKVASDKNDVKLSTEAISVTVDTATGALTFLSKDGNAVLAEAKNGGKEFDVPSVFETKTWQSTAGFSFAFR